MLNKDRTTPRDKLLNAVIVLCVLIVLLFIAIWSIHNEVAVARQEGKDQAEQSRSDTLTNREQGYKNRAKTCSLVLTLGGPLDSFCLEPEVIRYYDPNMKPTVGDKSPTRALLCRTEADLNELRAHEGLQLKPVPDECLLVTTTTMNPR